LVNSFNVHLGIVNFYPVMFGLIEDKEKVKASLKVLSDPEIMLSKSGIRSLSKGD
jgi:hypothetical protein